MYEHIRPAFIWKNEAKRHDFFRGGNALSCCREGHRGATPHASAGSTCRATDSYHQESDVESGSGKTFRARSTEFWPRANAAYCALTRVGCNRGGGASAVSWFWPCLKSKKSVICAAMREWNEPVAKHVLEREHIASPIHR